MKVAIYARSATRHQTKTGPNASQVEALLRYAKEQGFRIAEEYVCEDEGYSGIKLNRPELSRLRGGAQAGAFDAVLVLSADRLSRKYADLTLILEEFERHEVKVVFLDWQKSSETCSFGMPTNG